MPPPQRKAKDRILILIYRALRYTHFSAIGTLSPR